MEPQIDEAQMENDVCSRVWLVKPDPSVTYVLFSPLGLALGFGSGLDIPFVCTNFRIGFGSGPDLLCVGEFRRYQLGDGQILWCVTDLLPQVELGCWWSLRRSSTDMEHT
jgi:hypothetical protein